MHKFVSRNLAEVLQAILDEGGNLQQALTQLKDVDATVQHLIKISEVVNVEGTDADLSTFVHDMIAAVAENLRNA